MSLDTVESAEAIGARMDRQRAQLHRQFVRPPLAPGQEEDRHLQGSSGAMQPYQPRSLLMKILVANPQLLQRLAVLAATTALGARYSSWAMRLFGLFLAVRKKS